MPPKQRISKDDIVLAGIELVRKNGIDGVNARSVAAKLNCSTQPIFSNYASMDELKKDIIKTAYEKFMEYTLNYKPPKDYPKYKNTGLAYVSYAKNEPELFKLLFMRHRSSEEYSENDDSNKPVISIIKGATELSEDEAELFHNEMWIFVHGIATMVATDYMQLSDEAVSDMLTDIYQGLLKRFLEKRD